MKKGVRALHYLIKVMSILGNDVTMLNNVGGVMDK